MQSNISFLMKNRKALLQVLKGTAYLFLFSFMGVGELNGKCNFFKKTNNQLNTTHALKAHAVEENDFPISAEAVVAQPLSKKDANQKPPLSVLGVLNITGSFSITDSKNVAITTASRALLGITVGGIVQISIPEGGSFTINGTPYISSPIAGLIITQNSQPGVRIDSANFDIADSHGVYIGTGTLVNVQGDIIIRDNVATSSNNGDAFGLFNDGTITARGTSGSITIRNNQAISSDSDQDDAYGVYNDVDGIITATGAITINSNAARVSNSYEGNAYAVFNNGKISSTSPSVSGAIIISSNQAISNNSQEALGVYNNADATITAIGLVTINSNTAKVSNDDEDDAYGIENQGNISSVSGAVIIKDNAAEVTGDGNAYGVSNEGEESEINASEGVKIEGNTGSVTGNGNAFGFKNDNNVKAPKSIIINSNRAITSGNGNAYGVCCEESSSTVTTSMRRNVSSSIVINNNAATSNGNGNAYGICRETFADIAIRASGSIAINGNTATTNGNGNAHGVCGKMNAEVRVEKSGSITINSNMATSNGSGNAFGVHNSDTTITTLSSGSIKINSNTATTNGNGFAFGVYNFDGLAIIAEGLSGTITMSSNQATTTGSENAFGVLNTSRAKIIAAGAITMSSNQATGSGPIFGVLINSGNVKTDGNFTIVVATTPAGTNQGLLSNPIKITNSTETAALPFSQFEITIDTNSYGTVGGNYNKMQNDHLGAVTLHLDNQLQS